MASMAAFANGSTEPVQDFRPGLTIGQAASRLGVSPSTVRRWVRSGRLRSERVTVGDGFEYRIPAEGLEAVTASTNPSAEPATNPSTEPPTNGSTNASAPAILEASVERSTALAAYNAQLLGPLTLVIERQQDTIRQQAEQIGSLRAQLAAAEERIRGLDAPRPREGQDPGDGAVQASTRASPRPGPDGRSWWQRWWAALLGTPG
jgi:excisionase family DNA binding protein